MLPVLYNNNYQIVQTPDAVMILVEMVHDVRIIRMNGTHAAARTSASGWAIRSAIGKATRWWWTPPISTTRTRFRGSSENLHVIERFQRVDASTILYRVTIDDPATFTKPGRWNIRLSRRRVRCMNTPATRGNYAMTDILGGARGRWKGSKK